MTTKNVIALGPQVVRAMINREYDLNGYSRLLLKLVYIYNRTW